RRGRGRGDGAAHPGACQRADHRALRPPPGVVQAQGRVADPRAVSGAEEKQRAAIKQLRTARSSGKAAKDDHQISLLYGYSLVVPLDTCRNPRSGLHYCCVTFTSGRNEFRMSSSVAARRETVGRSTPRAYLVLVVALLLVQCALRIHKSAAFPVYIDVSRHIHRAQLVYTFENNPIEFSNGKLLVYYWLGLFSPQGHSAVIVGRYAIAIVSLITGAVTCSIARRLFGPLPALFALAFYALAPHVVFFERLALADPVASALATLSIWQLLR